MGFAECHAAIGLVFVPGGEVGAVAAGRLEDGRNDAGLMFIAEAEECRVLRRKILVYAHVKIVAILPQLRIRNKIEALRTICIGRGEECGQPRGQRVDHR